MDEISRAELAELQERVEEGRERWLGHGADVGSGDVKQEGCQPFDSGADVQMRAGVESLSQCVW